MGLVLLPIVPSFCLAVLLEDTSMAGIMDFLAALPEGEPALPEAPGAVDFLAIFKAFAMLLEAMPVPSAVDFLDVFTLLGVAFSGISRDVGAFLSDMLGSSLSDEDGDEALIRITSDDSDLSEPFKKVSLSLGCGSLKLALSAGFCFLGLPFSSPFLPFSFSVSCRFGISLHKNNLIQII